MSDTAVATMPFAAPVKVEAPRKVSLVVMSGDMDKLFGAFIIATGAAAMGNEVTMFFTFWGLRALKDADAKATGKTFFGRMLGMMYGGGIEKASPSKFSFGGMGRWMFGKMMKSNNVPSCSSCATSPSTRRQDVRLPDVDGRHGDPAGDLRQGRPGARRRRLLPRGGRGVPHQLVHLGSDRGVAPAARRGLPGPRVSRNPGVAGDTAPHRDKKE